MPAGRRTPIRTNRRTKKKYPIRATQPIVAEDIQVIGTGYKTGLFGRGQKPPEFVPWTVTSRLRDGRKFTVKINAYSQQEAIQMFKEKFPLATITNVKRFGHPTLYKIAKTIGPPGFLGN